MIVTYFRSLLESDDGLSEQPYRVGPACGEPATCPRMKTSWDNGGFWVIYGARKNLAFDAIFWRELDSRFFGQSGVSQEDAWMKWLDMVDEPEMAGIKAFV
uniref:Uncharacterized protein n=1 Tax=Photinus pyralis TaxID=7054 RepID=A0A1Y1KP81_PHOPY